MKDAAKTKIVKEIKVDVNKCSGCKSCEMVCGSAHAVPKYSILNPARSRIRVIIDEHKDVFVPIRAGEYTQAECNGRNLYVIDGKEYSECSFCPASCPSREAFKEPDSGLPLKCDMCESLSESVPMCVQVCHPGALTYEEREVPRGEVEEAPHGEMELGLESLVNRYGLKEVIETVARIAKGKH
ncbi:MAG: (4Fe-4S)-binding protein [Deltaproteobacteria bacterium]|nr:(4Fe-4S)-binding protein [Deltaproteobacteria bacterium]